MSVKSKYISRHVEYFGFGPDSADFPLALKVFDKSTSLSSDNQNILLQEELILSKSRKERLLRKLEREDFIINFLTEQLDNSKSRSNKSLDTGETDSSEPKDIDVVNGEIPPSSSATSGLIRPTPVYSTVNNIRKQRSLQPNYRKSVGAEPNVADYEDREGSVYQYLNEFSSKNKEFVPEPMKERESVSSEKTLVGEGELPGDQRQSKILQKVDSLPEDDISAGGMDDLSDTGPIEDVQPDDEALGDRDGGDDGLTLDNIDFEEAEGEEEEEEGESDGQPIERLAGGDDADSLVDSPRDSPLILSSHGDMTASMVEGEGDPAADEEVESLYENTSNLLRATRRSEFQRHDSVALSSSPNPDTAAAALPPAIPAPTEEDKLRHRILTDLFDCIGHNLALLVSLQKHRHTLEVNASTSQPEITKKDVDEIFFEIDNLKVMHSELHTAMKPKLIDWNHTLPFGDELHTFFLKMTILTNYVLHNKKALNTLRKCCRESPILKNMAKEISWEGAASKTSAPGGVGTGGSGGGGDGRERASLEEALRYPLQWLARNAIMLKDLIKYTHKRHADYNSLKHALDVSCNLLEELNVQLASQSASLNRTQTQRIVKENQIVELCGGERKLRKVLLFADVIMCAKINAGGRKPLTLKWCIPLPNVRFNQSRNRKSMDSTHELSEQMQTQISKWKKELTKLKQNIFKIRERGNFNRTSQRDKYKRKIEELEMNLAIHNPRYGLTIFHQTASRKYVLLFSSDYERNEWLTAISTAQAQEKAKGVSSKKSSVITAVDVEARLAAYTSQTSNRPSVMESALLADDNKDAILNGILKVRVHKLQGSAFDKPANSFVSLEVDSYGHVFRQAQTDIVVNQLHPVWEQVFDIELDGAEALRFLCYEQTSSKDKLVGMSRLPLDRKWLKDGYENQRIYLTKSGNTIQPSTDSTIPCLVVSIQYDNSMQTLRRTHTILSGAHSRVFGVPIEIIARQERSGIPIIVSACTRAVEERGAEELGIYRVSANTAEVDKLKTAFEKNCRAAAHDLANYDIHAVTGVLKLYFRTIPDSLFTDHLYHDFVQAYTIPDKAAMKHRLLELIHSLPEHNFTICLHLFDHLIQISKNEIVNKMSLRNLATIFGPTLIRPANEELNLGLMMAQNSVKMSLLLYFLNLRESGHEFDRGV